VGGLPLQRVFPPLSNLWRYELWRCEHGSDYLFGCVGAVSTRPDLWRYELWRCEHGPDYLFGCVGAVSTPAKSVALRAVALCGAVSTFTLWRCELRHYEPPPGHSQRVTKRNRMDRIKDTGKDGKDSLTSYPGRTKDSINNPEVTVKCAHYTFDMAHNKVKPCCKPFHDYLQKKNSRGEDVMYIHADNCVGQNKHNILLGYLAWRVANDKNKKIVLSFMPVGHTKFSCDWAFGLLKRKFRITYISSIQELVDCVEQSTPRSHVNTAISVGEENGNVNIDVYDWLSFFQKNNY
ncbi:hypothetical protein J6590_107187, partial [Homalodisca vitripennis]